MGRMGRADAGAQGGMSYLSAFKLEPVSYDNELQAEDRVCMGSNSTPEFFVVAVSGDKAWIRGISQQIDAVVDVRRCRKIDSAGRANAPAADG